MQADRLAAMRVIAGQYRSRPLRSLRGMDIRPTSDRLRETLFNVLTAGRPRGAGRKRVARPVRRHRGGGHRGAEPGRARRATLSSRRRAPPRSSGRTCAPSASAKDLRSTSATCSGRCVCSTARRWRQTTCFSTRRIACRKAYDETLGFLSQSRLLRPGERGDRRAREEIRSRRTRSERCERFRLLQQGDAALSFYRLSG